MCTVLAGEIHHFFYELRYLTCHTTDEGGGARIVSAQRAPPMHAPDVTSPTPTVLAHIPLHTMYVD
ncbi:hypothetical protein GBAR_LOCUS10232 [Geodia barretti]|uniref:Uncharacterized protein n=1 Tax=Geodia barretti TaxID=519541 RepID=A0AA35RSY8_GEOBA|nr:hypothetical protein GBAR_LOCUS10232 [Geodia barretti]